MKRTALVTGGARGIGMGISTCLAAEGWDLAICGMREESAAAGALGALRDLGAAVVYVQADVSDAAARRRLVDVVRDRYGRLNLLINNAGVAPKARTDILDATEESFEWVLKVNLQGPYFLTQAVARWMIAEKRAAPSFSACVVNISSISATVASVNRGEYCVSKAGLAMATKLWSSRLGECDIPVYEVRPGIIRTDMNASVQEKYDRLFAQGAAIQSRWGEPEDVGRVVAALARGDFPYSTGQVFMVDGGLTVARL